MLIEGSKIFAGIRELESGQRERYKKENHRTTHHLPIRKNEGDCGR